jgi:hypothetical protein
LQVVSQTELCAHQVMASERIRYDFGTPGNRIFRRANHKRGSAKHLGISPSLFEDRCSIQLGYGRVAQSESKVFYGVRRTLFDFEIEQFGNAVSGRGRDQRSVRRLDS